MRPFLFLVAFLTAISTVYARGSFGADQPQTTPVSATLSVFDISSGKAKTLFTLDDQSLSAPAFAGRNVFVATSGKKVLAIDSKTGHINWEYTTNHPVFSLLTASKEVYVGAGATLLALDPRTGTVRWSFDNDMALTDPAPADGLVTFNSVDGPIAMDPATGKTRWRLNVQWGYFICSALSDHRLCVWKPDEIYVIDTESGKTLWQSAADSSVSAPGALPSPAVAAGEVICQLRGSRTDPRDWSIFNLDAGSGKTLWKTNLGDHLGAAARTLISGNTVYCVLDENLFALDLKTGEKKWRASTKPLETNGTGMTADANTIVLPQIGGNLLALDAETGKQRWLDESSAPSRKNIMRTAGMVITTDSVYVARNEFAR
ncbi:MAG TPA: PQQ-binding-like beta-propeller repeat protein [Tepidisphaeraceae bacterium]|jgi:outer membrane protein assembly factor BamB|nr:PQQ-binding-like beta-propeller repeat protein [Tepidisphaeraceae bacterium]